MNEATLSRLLLRSSEKRVEFNLSASANFMTPSVPILLSESRENEMSTNLLLLRRSEVRDVFDLSASDNLMAPSLPILLSVLSENETMQRGHYCCGDRVK
jgi:3-oxoacyl-[acyl-carrier-protein] synthase III